MVNIMMFIKAMGLKSTNFFNHLSLSQSPSSSFHKIQITVERQKQWNVGSSESSCLPLLWLFLGLFHRCEFMWHKLRHVNKNLNFPSNSKLTMNAYMPTKFITIINNTNFSIHWCDIFKLVSHIISDEIIKI